LKRLFDTLSEQLKPLYFTEISLSIRPYKIEYGLIYMPSIEF